MNIQKVTVICFSPTDSTKKVLTALAAAWPMPVEMIDITDFIATEKSYSFGPDELVLFGVPVYGGRVPEVAVRRLEQVKGSKTPAVLVATYGNRDYDDALLELHDITQKNGFMAVAAAAFITEHSIMHSIATGRPDETDKAQIHRFAASVAAKINQADGAADFGVLALKGQRPYKEYKGVPLKPAASKSCTQCGICVDKCPVRAIPADKPDTTDKKCCISCMRCTRVCPVQARRLNKQLLWVVEKLFAKKCSVRREPDCFL